MKKVGRAELRNIIMNEMRYTSHTIDDKGDGGYGIRKSDRGSISLETRNALNSIGVDYMDEDGIHPSIHGSQVIGQLIAQRILSAEE